MNTTPRSNRYHIAIVGRRNVGKSSLINAIANQDISLVSSTPGTPTDPVYKAMELQPFGPVVLIDTAGIDDTGALGKERTKRSYAVLDKADLVVLVTEASDHDPPEPVIDDDEKRVIELARDRKLPLLVAVNKLDSPESRKALVKTSQTLSASLDKNTTVCAVSAKNRGGVDELIEAIKAVAEQASQNRSEVSIIGDLIEPGDTVILVCPIDEEAPKSRLILPQVQTIRDTLDHDALALVVQPARLRDALNNLKSPPALVVTDSQVFSEVAKVVPDEVPLTSFSILFARHRGDLDQLKAGIKAVDSLKPGDKVLIAEACTHHPIAEDIARVKIPRWLQQRVGNLQFDFCSGGGFPDDLSSYALIIHCGGCMVNRRQMLNRLRVARSAGVPITNYGLLISHIKGILPRAIQVFDLHEQQRATC